MDPGCTFSVEGGYLMMRVLVTGGSGFLGINLTRHLLEHGFEVSSIDFAPFDYPDCKDKIRMVDGDIRDRARVDDAMEGVDAVVHCAAALPLYSEEDIMTTDVDGTRNVVESALEHGVKRFVHISSTAVYGVPDHHPLYERDALVGVGAYGKAKILAEGICSGARGKGMHVTILRPKSFIGPERLGVFALLYDWAHTGHNFPILGKGDNPYQFLDVEDLCEVIRFCLEGPEEPLDDVYNIGAEIFTTLREDFQAVLDMAGHRKRIVSVPVMPAIFALRLLEKMGGSPLYRWIYDTVFRESFVSIKKAKENMGFRPTYSNKEALVRNFNWYVEHRKEFSGKAGVSHRVPWKQGMLGIAKLFF
jgi:nucleoside-diphosphate-sugar epimerase